MSVPKLGTYRAKDNAHGVPFEFIITHANPEIAELRGTYHAQGSHAGEITSPLTERDGDEVQPERSSSYSWVARTEHGVRINEPPFLIRIVGLGSKVDDKKNFIKAQHTWTGIYHPDGTIAMRGDECYIVFDEHGNLTGSGVIPLSVNGSDDVTFTYASEPAA